MSNKIIVEIEFVEHNFGAHVPALQGCVATGATPGEVAQNITDAIKWHLEGLLEDGIIIPKEFQVDYDLIYKFEAQSLLKYYKGLLGNTAIERLTGINNKQLNHYATGHRNPGEKTKQKILNGLHRFGRELMAVEL